MTSPQGPARHRFGWASGPRVTYILIAICVACFIGQQISPRIAELLAFSPHVAEAGPYRFLTSAFLHANTGHLLFNMLALFALGQALEPLLGTIRYLTLYVLGALGGNVAVLLWAEPWAPTWFTFVVGASGAIFALFGAILVWHKQLGSDLRAILTLLGINLFLPLLDPMISWQAHLGGLATGILASLALSKRSAALNAAGVAAIIAVLVGLTLAFGY